MKKIATIIAVMLSITAYSQIVVYAAQDARLALIGDKKGNSAFTPNINFGFEFREQHKNYDYVLKPDIEFASLRGGNYLRYSANFGMNFKNWIKDFEITSTIGYGMLQRPKYSSKGFGANFQITYLINRNFGIYLDAEIIERNDLKTPVVRFSGKIGIKYYF